MLEGRGPDLSDRRLSRPTSASFMTARLGNAALVIALALALGIAGDLTLAATNSDAMLADSDLTPVAAPSPPTRTRPARLPRALRSARTRSEAAVCAAARRARALYALARSRCTARTISCRYGIASRDLYMDIYYYYYYYY